MAKQIYYYVDSKGLGLGNRELSEMDCDECPEKMCSDGKRRGLWRLPSREKLDNFLGRAEQEQWVVYIFWARSNEEKPKRILASDLDLNEERLNFNPDQELVKDAQLGRSKSFDELKKRLASQPGTKVHVTVKVS